LNAVCRRSRICAIWLCACLVLLSACSTLRPDSADSPWTSGRLWVRVAASPERSAQSLSADFELRAAGDAGELRLTGPLGARLATAQWAPGQALLLTPAGTQRFQGLEDLSRQALGENLPLAALPDWLKGRPWPQAASVNNDAGFEQLGWQISLARQSEGWIEARRAAPPEVLVRVKLDGAS
jgi:outer membrane lipoprotein LolB